eukprot:Plantae.Rhodophyta-Purpureofilum_apyrenoidigerum.ctg9007.p1 GENE.Plantae.Rhodophyta-Purpureofilum_apyrenoidigerum.ctg9007~~Plantae.Rhodophyta-Purpureofilum_apyrenoidigerum.ctg9007.p1  ORF type:complete len:394 (-),score=105.23 Plantae.Rhodophyta-Purpureofilum_apyrenoidigerum.ctg9007:808-1830(-)
MAVFDVLVNELKEDLDERFELPMTAREYIERSVKYNVPHGKLNRGLAVVQCMKDYTKGTGNTVSQDDVFRASVLGWCVEFLQAFFLVADDIMDASLTRRGQPCFYKLPEIGMKAINDSIILDNLIYVILKRHFRHMSCYVELLNLFHEITYVTSLGQLLDLTSQKEQGDVDLRCFTHENLERIYRYKTAHYSFYLPVALAMHLCGVSDDKLFGIAKDVCIDMGIYFQAQDDFIDCFGDPNVTGKVGTDIEDNKCTWLVVEALKVASEDEKRILEENYGRPDEGKVRVVKSLYQKLQLEQRFHNYEEMHHNKLVDKIEKAKLVMPTGAMEFLLNKIFKRSK